MLQHSTIRRAGLALALAATLSVPSLAQQRAMDAWAQEAPAATAEAANAPAQDDDRSRIVAAMKMLQKQGYKAEATRLREILAEMDAGKAGRADKAKEQKKKRADSRAKKKAKADQKKQAKKDKRDSAKQEGAAAKRKAEREKQKAETGQRKAAAKLAKRGNALLEMDVNERSTRLDMLDHIGAGYEAIGDESSAIAMRWFADAGRATADGASGPQPAMPDVLSRGEGPLMDRLIVIVQGGVGAYKELGDRRSARVADRLGKFYVERESGRAAEPGGMAQEAEPAPRAKNVEPSSEEAAKISVEDLVTVEKRVPLISRALRAYEMSGDNADLAPARERMRWMTALGSSRLAGNDAEVPAAPSVVSMDQLIEDIARAGRLYDEAGDSASAEACRALAKYYRLRAAGQIADESSEAPSGAGASGERGFEGRGEDVPQEPSAMGSAKGSAELMERKAALEARVQELRAEVQALRDAIDAMRKGDR